MSLQRVLGKLDFSAYLAWTPCCSPACAYQRPHCLSTANPARPQFVPAAAAPRYVCAGCGVDVACEAQLLWEGFMNVSTPAFLFKAAVNTQGASPPRQELLSTGRYKLHDVSCRGCSALLGWQYLWAERQVRRARCEAGGSGATGALGHGALCTHSAPNTVLPFLESSAVLQWRCRSHCPHVQESDTPVHPLCPCSLQDQQYKTGAFLLDQATLLRLNTKPRLQEAAERAAAAGASQLLAE